MKKMLFFSLCLCCIAELSHGQVRLTRSVVASTGGSAQVGNTLVQFTIGEPAVTTFTSSRLVLTQGFQQPEFTLPNILVPVVGNMRVFPNPAASYTKIDFDLLADAKVLINLVNNAGQIVHARAVNSMAGKLEYILPLSSFSPGIYHVVLYVNFKTYSEKLIIQ